MLAIFVIDKNFFINYTTTSEDCEGGKCQRDDSGPEISAKNTTYFINDAMKSEPGEYYRLIFEEKTNSDTRTVVELSDASDKRVAIGTFDFKRSDEYSFKEITFPVSGRYTDLVFKKEKAADESRIFIKNVNLTKLALKDEKEYTNLKPTLIGKMDTNVLFAEQMNNEKKFSQLRTENTMIGQVFQSESAYISGAAFDIDITKIDNRGGKKYKLDLREVEFDGEIYVVSKNSLASLNFTVSDLEKYRQADGKIRFPIFSFVKRGEYYFIGIDNGRVKIDEFNFLTLRGAEDSAYSDGAAVVKKSGDTLRIGGDLYFRIYGAKFTQYGGERVLAGTIVEDIGQGKGMFTYKTSGYFNDLIDIDSASSDVRYDSEERVITGMSDAKNSYYTYRFNTIYPAKKISIKAQQADIEWSKVQLSYSFDQKVWKDVSDTHDDGVQRFDFTIENSAPKSVVFIKIAPVSGDSSGQSPYGIRDLEVRGDLIMK